LSYAPPRHREEAAKPTRRHMGIAKMDQAGASAVSIRRGRTALAIGVAWC
jgi:hypothetical protein